ncbi:hypothetical protein E3N88_35884 [Mikania micrantha]|uniref:SRP54-type proteins GTP-binding domain-containing protein n=1 Tax=Mikania micrantha TaxID=192012 RepID=A0A5N6M270_9ASTR|nr:hypothetical protein E3N88_35884 [Mikania micrantha]
MKKSKQVMAKPVSNLGKKQGQQMQKSGFESGNRKKSGGGGESGKIIQMMIMYKQASWKTGIPMGRFPRGTKEKTCKKEQSLDESPPETKLDFTDPVSENGEADMALAQVVEGESMMDKDEVFSSDSETEDEDEAATDKKVDSKKKGWFTSMFQSIAGKANLEKADLEPALRALKDRLMTKNVAAMEDALVRILTPRRSIDILRMFMLLGQHKPYVVVFVGVMELESTNLQRLQIPIFEKGYEKDPAIVAKEAIQEATRNGSDVVLVDTAGRMQDNEPLMRALSKLIYVNSPDLVGAALSMVYISGAPVMFVGCGQSYTDLKKLNVKSIVKTLLK